MEHYWWQILDQTDDPQTPSPSKVIIHKHKNIKYKTNMTPNPNTQKRKYSVQQILEHAPDPHPAPPAGSCAPKVVSSAHKYTHTHWVPEPTKILLHMMLTKARTHKTQTVFHFIRQHVSNRDESWET